MSTSNGCHFIQDFLLVPGYNIIAILTKSGSCTLKGETAMQKITPFLWFNDNAEAAMNFYISIFKNSKILHVMRQGEGEPLMTATFQLEGQEFMALNGGPHFKFNEAISLFVSCDLQTEVDTLWAKLTANGGEESQCG